MQLESRYPRGKPRSKLVEEPGPLPAETGSREFIQSSLLFETPEEICRRVHRHLCPQGAEPGVSVEFRRFAGMRSVVRLREGALELRVSDLLEGAPAVILEAIFYILLAKLYRKPVPPAYRQRFRLYLRRRDVSCNEQRARLERGQKILSAPTGETHCLARIFAEINVEYFAGQLAQPRLGWSPRRARTRLGHYDPAHHTISLSRILDAPGIPQFVVEYVLFHEMLHLRFPVEHDQRTGRRLIHTRAFREAEAAFPRLKEAKAWLKSLPSGPACS